MYSDLFDALNGQQGQGGNSGGGNRDNDGKHIVLSFKAGKMDMALQDNGKYMVTPDPRRGQVQLVWERTSSCLKWEWYDRRAKTVVDSFIVTEGHGGTFERVDTGAGRETDRVYLWQKDTNDNDNDDEEDSKFTMYWMQDLPSTEESGETKEDDEDDNEIVVKVNQFLTNPNDANPDATPSSNETSANAAVAASTNATNTSTTNALDPEALLQVMQGGAAGTSGSGSGASGSQVDALSNILENLGMPQPNNTTTTTGGAADSSAAATAGSTEAGSGATTSSAASGTGAPAGTLTLADLQGAMAGLATSTPPATPPITATATSGPPLTEVVNTPGLIQSLLEDDKVVDKLLPLLPENQRTKAKLEENLTSPQLLQTLRSLTSALLPDEDGSLEGYHSVICNFQLDPKDGQDALTQQSNPIQAFLDCIVKQVEREKKDEEGNDNDATKDKDAMEES